MKLDDMFWSVRLYLKGSGYVRGQRCGVPWRMFNLFSVVSETKITDNYGGFNRQYYQLAVL